MAQVDVDHVDPLGGPAERGRPAAQVVLARGRLGVVRDLVEGRLADIQIGVTAEPGCGDLSCGIGRVHGGRASCSAGGAVRAWASVICASTATIRGTTAAGSSDVQAGELAPPSWSGAGNDGLRASRDAPGCAVSPLREGRRARARPPAGRRTRPSSRPSPWPPARPGHDASRSAWPPACDVAQLLIARHQVRRWQGGRDEVQLLGASLPPCPAALRASRRRASARSTERGCTRRRKAASAGAARSAGRSAGSAARQLLVQVSDRLPR